MHIFVISILGPNNTLKEWGSDVALFKVTVVLAALGRSQTLIHWAFSVISAWSNDHSSFFLDISLVARGLSQLFILYRARAGDMAFEEHVTSTGNGFEAALAPFFEDYENAPTGVQ